jgi:hypothetical protein
VSLSFAYRLTVRFRRRSYRSRCAAKALTVTCPIDGTIHHAKELFCGRFLRCASCGRRVLISPATQRLPLQSTTCLWRETYPCVAMFRVAANRGKRSDCAIHSGGMLLALAVLGNMTRSPSWIRHKQSADHSPSLGHRTNLRDLGLNRVQHKFCCGVL